MAIMPIPMVAAADNMVSLLITPHICRPAHEKCLSDIVVICSFLRESQRQLLSSVEVGGNIAQAFWGRQFTCGWRPFAVNVPKLDPPRLDQRFSCDLAIGD